MSDPHAPRKMGATLKFPESARYKNDNPWLVFEGTPASIREDILATVGLEDNAELSLVDIIAEAQKLVTAVGTVGSQLGGTVIASGKTSETKDPWAVSKTGSTPAAEKAPDKSEAEVEIERLTAEVSKVTTVADLQQLWARNQEAFKDTTLFASYQAKGKALSA